LKALLNDVERIFKNVGFYFFVPSILMRKPKMSGKWTLKYGLAAMLVAIIVIAAVLVTNPLSSITPSQKSSKGSFLVMLTDPPILPANANTTMLDLTYTNITLHVVYSNGTSGWVSVSASGTVDLLKLVNMSETIASTSIPINSTVDKIDFTISSVDATVNGTTYAVTTLSNTLVIAIANSKVNQTFSGVLVDFNPTLVMIQATNESGALVNYFVLVPSATAMIVTSLSRAQVKVGTIVELGQNNKEKLVRVVESFSKDLTIANAWLSTYGNVTSLNVTLKNEGPIGFRIFGLTLHGKFNVTAIGESKTRADTIPFRVNGTSLVPLLGADTASMVANGLILAPGQDVTLTFSGVLGFTRIYRPPIGPPGTAEPMWIAVIPIIAAPIVGNMYTLKLMNEGFQTLSVNATS
jgi:type VI protein secretion system component Hcp